MVSYYYDPWSSGGRDHLQAAGKHQGWEVFQADRGFDEVIWGKEELRRKAFYYFDLWWEREKRDKQQKDSGYYEKYMAGLDIEEMRRYFAAGFSAEYREDREKFLTPSPKVAITGMQHKRHTHVYELELTDSKNLEKPVKFELTVDDEGEAELRETSPPARETNEDDVV